MQVTRRNDAKFGTSPRWTRISSWNWTIRLFVVQPSSSAISARMSQTMFSSRMLVSTPWMRIVRERCSYWIGSALTKYSHMVGLLLRDSRKRRAVPKLPRSPRGAVAAKRRPWGCQMVRALICLAM
jgi:hypothetical protein